MGSDSSKPSEDDKVGQGFLAAGSWVLAIATFGATTGIALAQTEATRKMVEEDKDWCTAQREGFQRFGEIMDSANAVHDGLDSP